MKRTATITRADLLARLEAATVPAGPINDIADVFDDPQVRHRNMRSDLPHPAAAGGSVPGLRTPIVLDGRPMMHPGRSPMLGEHEIGRASCRERVFSTYRSRWSPYH